MPGLCCRSGHQQIDNSGDECEDDEHSEDSEDAAYGSAARLFLVLLLGLRGGVVGVGGFGFGNGLVEAGHFGGTLLALVLLGGSGFLGGSSASYAEHGEEVELLPGDEAFAVAHALAEADADVDACAADVQGLALGAYGEADTALAHVGSHVGEDFDAFVESYTHDEHELSS